MTVLDFKDLEEEKPRPSSFALTFTARELEAGLSVCIEYKPSAVPPAAASELVHRFPAIVEQVTTAPDTRLSRLALP